MKANEKVSYGCQHSYFKMQSRPNSPCTKVPLSIGHVLLQLHLSFLCSIQCLQRRWVFVCFHTTRLHFRCMEPVQGYFKEGSFGNHSQKIKTYTYSPFHPWGQVAPTLLNFKLGLAKTKCPALSIISNITNFEHPLVLGILGQKLSAVDRTGFERASSWTCARPRKLVAVVRA